MSQRLDLLHNFTIQDLCYKMPKSGTQIFKLLLCNRSGVWVDISGAIEIEGNEGYINLKYSIRGSQLHQTIRLASIPSNIGNSRVWYFICPFTGRRCRKIYLYRSYFRDRHNFDHIYRSQTLTPNQKNYLRIAEAANEVDRLTTMSFEKNYRKFYYNGKPTKWLSPILEARSMLANVDKVAYQRSGYKYGWLLLT
ncbi:hypothetical protein H8S90_21245 [Olivibacter sp. SDN3]|uniref:hypothetical protein n=1 Tax=Olivibacter sp. SDN3 TaxID=2764720 RepID=UPI0016512938|nr:hypothetical protein [Olivibacter sp. SDN3]QNL49238.1 hypothetical protein H8S90_21245 [Olivibacter sp. SDN3]